MTTKQNKMPQMIDLFVSLQIQCCYFCIFSSTDRCWDYSLVLPPLLSSIYKPFPQFSQCSINLTLLKLTPGTSRLEYIITIKINFDVNKDINIKNVPFYISFPFFWQGINNTIPYLRIITHNNAPSQRSRYLELSHNDIINLHTANRGSY